MLVTSAKFKVKKSNWLPSDAEQSCVHSLMQHVAESEKMAGSMVLPDCGINAHALAFTGMKLQNKARLASKLLNTRSGTLQRSKVEAIL